MSLSKKESSVAILSAAALAISEFEKIVTIAKLFCLEVKKDVFRVIKTISLAIGIITGGCISGFVGATTGALMGLTISTGLSKVQIVQKLADYVWALLPELLKIILVGISDVIFHPLEFINNVGEKIQNSPIYQKLCTTLETIALLTNNVQKNQLTECVQ